MGSAISGINGNARLDAELVEAPPTIALVSDKML